MLQRCHGVKVGTVAQNVLENMEIIKGRGVNMITSVER